MTTSQAGNPPTFVWDACGGVQYYEIYKRNAGGLWSKRATTTNTTYTDNRETVDYTRDAIEKEYKVKAVNAFGSSGWSNTENVWVEDPFLKISSAIPDVFGLHQNYPNPFNPVTKIRFQVPEASEITITVYNVNGELVETLVNGFVSPGYLETSWDASVYASGVYFARMAAGTFTYIIKMSLIK